MKFQIWPLKDFKYLSIAPRCPVEYAWRVLGRNVAGMKPLAVRSALTVFVLCVFYAGHDPNMVTSRYLAQARAVAFSGSLGVPAEWSSGDFVTVGNRVLPAKPFRIDSALYRYLAAGGVNPLGGCLLLALAFGIIWRRAHA